MAGQQYQIRGDTRANLASVTPAAKEIFSVTDKQGEMGIGNGATAANGNALLLKRKGHNEGLSPAQITATQNDYNPSGLAYAETLYLNSDAARTITGIAGGDTDRFLNIINIGSFNITLSDADAGSSAANRFSFGASVVLRPKQAVIMVYSAASSRWLALSDAFLWKNVIDLPENVTLSGDISPAQITSNQNDYNPTGLSAASVLRLNTDASRNITGIAGGADGRIIKIFNVGAFPIVLVNADTNSTAANRFDIGVNITLTPKQSISLWYDATTSRWNMSANTAGAAVADGAVTASKVTGSTFGQCTGTVNVSLVESHAANAATFAVKTLAGTDPSPSDPAYFTFLSGGAYFTRAVTAALSLTISAGSSMGFSSGVPGKIWLGALDNAGTVELFAINCLSGINIFPFGQAATISTTAEGGAGAADSAQVAYSVSARANKVYLPLGYAEYGSGLAAAGNWAASPTRLELYGPRVPLPGQLVGNRSSGTFASTTSTSGTSYVTSGQSATITPISACNLIRATAQGTLRQSTQAVRGFARMYRTSNANMFGSEVEVFTTTGSVMICPAALEGYDAPGTASAVTYFVGIKDGSGGTTIWNDSNTSQMNLDEVMT